MGNVIAISTSDPISCRIAKQRGVNPAASKHPMLYRSNRMSEIKDTSSDKLKQCLACWQFKSLSEFSHHPGTNNLRHGKYSRCNVCFAAGIQIHEGTGNTRQPYVSQDDCPSFPIIEGRSFRHCDGHTGLAVDDKGNAWSCHGDSGWRLRTWVLRIASPNSRGYRRTTFRQRTVFVSQLVATAFHGPRPVGMEVCHDDGNRANDVPSNLYWGTHSQNELDKRRHGTSAQGERNPGAKTPVDVVLRIKELRRQGMSRSQIKAIIPTTIYIIDRVIYGQTWTHV